MGLTLYNTLTGRKEPFEPLDAGNVRMYVCGPTVYDDAHIGNARPIIVFDVLYRLLRHLYGGDHVTYARNITDVDDKINARAAEEGVAIGELTERTIKRFHEDVAELGCLPPTIEPRATGHIEEMKALIECLVEKGNAYVAEDHALFDVESDPDYGKLSRRSTDEMIAGARVEVAPYKKNPMDFVLWKPSKEGEPAWDSPCGIAKAGRPGWHIECSAMAARHLGETFDIHGGGVDLVFPHHENEIAQSTCCHGTDRMARVWMHNGYLQVEGRKMAKSEGNFITIRELLTGWGGYAWPGEALRFNMLRAQYRQPLDWTFHSLDESHKILWDWYGQLKGQKAAKDVPDSVITALCEDLHTPKAIAEMHKLANSGQYDALMAVLNLLGFSGKRDRIVRSPTTSGEAIKKTPGIAAGIPISADRVEEMVAARTEARKARNFAEADRIREELAEMGIVLEDKPDGRTEWEIAR